MRVQSEDRKNDEIVMQNCAVGRAVGNVITRSAGMKQGTVWIRAKLIAGSRATTRVEDNTGVLAGTFQLS